MPVGSSSWCSTCSRVMFSFPMQEQQALARSEAHVDKGKGKGDVSTGAVYPQGSDAHVDKGKGKGDVSTGAVYRDEGDVTTVAVYPQCSDAHVDKGKGKGDVSTVAVYSQGDMHRSRSRTPPPHKGKCNGKDGKGKGGTVNYHANHPTQVELVAYQLQMAEEMVVAGWQGHRSDFTEDQLMSFHTNYTELQHTTLARETARNTGSWQE
jgi:hypothetical protein